jgi:hypothetical protein
MASKEKKWMGQVKSSRMKKFKVTVESYFLLLLKVVYVFEVLEFT